MGNQTSNLVVVLFWLATMTWLVVAKVLPPLRVGEPPNYATILQESSQDPPTCWAIRMQGRTIGWATSKTVRRSDGIHELFSRVYLGELPIEELAPGWLANVLKPVFADSQAMDLDKRSRLVIDPLGRLSEFESRVRLGNLTDVIRVMGTVDGSTLNLSVHSGDFAAKLSRKLAPNALMSDELSPQTRMPGLRLGQSWTVPLYSPFHAPNTPLEILQAQVERELPFRWGDEVVLARVVVYRGDPGSGLNSGEARGRMWVRDDGTVLRQEATAFRTPLEFDRLPEAQAARIWRALGEDWNQKLSPDLATELLDRLRDPVRDEQRATEPTGARPTGNSSDAANSDPAKSNAVKPDEPASVLSVP